MALDDIVSVNITLESSQVSRASFGVPLVAAYHTHNTDRVRTYEAASALADMVVDGFTTTERAYKAVQALLSANPRVASIKVGRRDGAWQQITTITPTAVTNSSVYSVVVNGALATFTSDSSALLAEICTGLAAAIDALPLVAAVSTGTAITVTTTAPATVASFSSPVRVKVDDDSVDATVVADLTAIRAFDDGWYGFVLDSNSDAEILLAAAWAETQTVIFGATLHGTRAYDASDTTDTATALKSAAYKRTFWVPHKDANVDAAAAWMGVMFPFDPSFGETWNFRTLPGVSVESLSQTEINAILGKNGNVYVTKAGVLVTRHGSVVKSPTSFIDQVTLVDEIKARIQERVFTLLLNGLPYSNESADRVCAEILAVLYQRVDRGSLLNDPAPTCSHPDVATVDPGDRSARLLPDVVFSAQTAGRIHSVSISGKLSV